MGKKPDEIENEIQRKRDEIEQRVISLEQRAKDDVASMRDAAKDKASGVSDSASNFVDFPRMAREHPLSTVLGSLGVGVALGMASEGMHMTGGMDRGRRHDGRRPQRRSFEDNDEGDGMVASFLGPVLSTATTTFQDELKNLIQTGFAGFSEKAGESSRQKREEREFQESTSESNAAG